MAASTLSTGNRLMGITYQRYCRMTSTGRLDSHLRRGVLSKENMARIGIVVLGMALLMPSLTFGQTTGTAGILGVVKDETGAVLPGVIVEAASPALIEKTRSTVTDGQGRYNIIELRTGTYAVTFS